MNEPKIGTEAVLEEIHHERKRQVVVEGMSRLHDDAYTRNELALAAMSYCQSGSVAAFDTTPLKVRPPIFWPWSKDWWKPKDKRRDLTRAAALVVAEIERLDRKIAMTGSCV